MRTEQPALRRVDGSADIVGWVGGYSVRLHLAAVRLRVIRERGNDEVFNRVHGVDGIAAWVVSREDDRILIALKRSWVGGQEIIWLYDHTDDDYGIGLNLSTRELTDWGPVP